MSKKYKPEHVKEMRALQSEGLKAREIAQLFEKLYPGITRDAVLGVIFRSKQ